ncbi:hypothetical protein DPMN_055604 [Dreissena polymorpha]|uniref:Uncharacterized protein n=1 Tax=Dreissena polymorpha TaxID=45954 RepID=A0A9D4CRX8_DREPO|nr:hypothetical protein DPMN_055604 [Dreissena polymorpha]
MYGFQVAHGTISKIIYQACDAILLEFLSNSFPVLKRKRSRKTASNSSATNGSSTTVLLFRRLANRNTVSSAW